MGTLGTRIGIAMVVCSCLTGRHLAWGQVGTDSFHSEARERARIVLSKALPKLNGDHLKVVLLEVNYGPGEASPPHSHPCAVIGYVVEGMLRTQVKGEPEMTY